MGTSLNSLIAGKRTSNPEVSATSPTAVMVNGNTIFTVVGDIQVLNLVSECITGNDATASTIQYSVTPTVGSVGTISGASASLASVAAGAVVTLVGDAFATAPIVSASGPALSQTARGIYVPSGAIKIVIGVGSTTGTWRHYLRYFPLEDGAYVI
jgi:hypothetical protein